MAYGVPQATITLIKKGKRNLAKRDDQIILKRKLFFQLVKGEDLHATIDALRKDEATYRHDPRFIVVTDGETLLAIDTKTQESLDIDALAIPMRAFSTLKRKAPTGAMSPASCYIAIRMPIPTAPAGVGNRI